MNILDFSTGRVSYSVNGVPNAVSFNPTDMTFVEKLLDFFEVCSKQHDSMSQQIQETSDNRKVFELIHSMEMDISKGINNLFGENAAENLFLGVSCCAMASGLPVWMNFLLAVMDEISYSCEAQKTELPARLQEIMQKYKK